MMVASMYKEIPALRSFVVIDSLSETVGVHAVDFEVDIAFPINVILRNEQRFALFLHQIWHQLTPYLHHG